MLGVTSAIANSDWRKQSPIPGPGNRIVATVVTPDGTRAATVTDDGYVTLWDVKHRKRLRTKHLPRGTPHHLAIRDQGDAIAIAYQNADAVIWWCDGSDKLVLPNVRARLVAFAHQKRLLVTADRGSTLQAWDIDTGTARFTQQHRIVNYQTDRLGVIASDDAAIAYNIQGNFFNGTGIDLTNGDIIEIEGGYSPDVDYKQPLITRQGELFIERFNTSKITYRRRFIQSFTAQGSRDEFAPSMIAERPNGYQVEPAYAPVLSHHVIVGIMAGNTTGDLVLYRRTQPGDWIKHPAPWLIIPAVLLLASVWIRRRQVLADSPRPVPTPADAALPLPRATVIAGWLTVAFGVYSLAQMIYDMTTGACMLNVGVLGILAGYKIVKHKRNGWRVFAVVLAWTGVAATALLFGVSSFGQGPFELSLGPVVHLLPKWTEVLLTGAMLGVSVFMFVALTHPLAVRICKAASTDDATKQARRFAELTRCPTCGYDTTQTVIDNLYACPECGREFEYTEEERDKVIAHRRDEPAG